MWKRLPILKMDFTSTLTSNERFNKEEAIAKIWTWLEEKGCGQEKRLPTVSATGSLAVNVTGVNQLKRRTKT